MNEFVHSGVRPTQPQSGRIGAGPVGRRRWQEVGQPATSIGANQGWASYREGLRVIGRWAPPLIGVGRPIGASWLWGGAINSGLANLTPKWCRGADQ